MKKAPAVDTVPDAPLPPKTSERLLIERWPEVAGDGSIGRVLVTSNGRAQLARFVAERHSQSQVECYFLDAYLLELAQQSGSDAAARPVPENLTWRCSADLVAETDEATDGTFDVVALPLSSRGDAELTREQLQQAYQALRPEALLLASTENARDVWLQEMVQGLGGKTRRYDSDDGAVYVVRKTGPLKRPRNFTAEFVYRDGDRLLNVSTRPGVFSHRRVDPGARRLIEAMQVDAGARVLDIGCGWGAVGLAAACRAEGVYVAAIDSNARAVTCTQANAARNGAADRLEARVEPAGIVAAPGTFDLVLANPPYYADFRIAEAFVQSAHAALRSGGKLLIVTKLPEWYHESLAEPFGQVTSELVKNYTVFQAVKR